MFEEILKSNKLFIKKTIEDITHDLSKDQDNRKLIFHRLKDIIRKHPLDISCYIMEVRDCNNYCKFEIYDNEDDEYPFSIFIFAFAPGQKTPIHSHKLDCWTSVISQAPIIETTYKIQNKTSKLHSEKIRYKDDIAYDLANSGYAHRIAHAAQNVKISALTMHMYYGNANQSSVCTIFEDETFKAKL